VIADTDELMTMGTRYMIACGAVVTRQAQKIARNSRFLQY